MSPTRRTQYIVISTATCYRLTDQRFVSWKGKNVKQSRYKPRVAQRVPGS